MDIKSLEKKIVHNYLKTLNRHNISNIPVNIYIKKPYIEQYIIDISEHIKENDINQHLHTWCPQTIGNLIKLAGEDKYANNKLDYIIEK